MANIGGSLKKLEIGGLTFAITTDNEPNFNPGGEGIIDKEITNEPDNTVFLVQNTPGVLSGLEIRLFTKNNSLENFKRLQEQSIIAPVSALVEFADGSKWTADGGVRIMTDSQDDGYANMRTGTTTISLIADGGRYIRVGG